MRFALIRDVMNPERRLGGTLQPCLLRGALNCLACFSSLDAEGCDAFGVARDHHPKKITGSRECCLAWGSR